MIGRVLKAVFGSKNDRVLKRMQKNVKKINELEPNFDNISDEELRAKTAELKQRCAEGETLDQLLPEAFAVVREGGKRFMSMRHFDVQMIGGIALHEGRIAEMRTGEGKTLVATLPAYLNALSGNGVHIVTVNEYLAERDANWMRPLYEGLGLSVGFIKSMQPSDDKRAAYACDITYGTNNEFGFDYLRDNMALALEDKVQRGLNFAIVDEVDSILIDEARTPLIISGAAADSSELYRQINRLVPLLKVQIEEIEGEKRILEAGHYTVDEKSRNVELTEDGFQTVEDWLIREGLLEEGDSLYAASNLSLMHHVLSAIKAHALFQRDVQYIVQNNQVVLIDEHSGRQMPGRRLSEGLHQAIEAKESVAIQSESQTLASTTFQNYFRLFNKLSGMTGTADTEAVEFHQIYGLMVTVIPTNKPVAREDLNDQVYMSLEEKYDAIIEDIKYCSNKNAPVLVGTASIDTSEELSRRLKKAGIKHEVLNAKQHEREAHIIAQAGKPGVVTIATNMAGRGTDIVLGGNWEAELAMLENPNEAQIKAVKDEWKKLHATVIEAGGLHIIGTERHESRRIDNQLRGRAGRQGDPGVSRFYLSMEDNLMRIFASPKIKSIMAALMSPGEPIEHRMVNNAIEKAQRKVEERNFNIRKHLLEFDDVANDQRQVVYSQREDILRSESLQDTITQVRAGVVDEMISRFIPPQSLEEQWNVSGLEQHIAGEFGLELPLQSWLDNENDLNEAGLRERIITEAQKAYDEKCERLGPVMRKVEKQVMLQVLDGLWKEHLSNMDHLRQGIGLRAYAQKNPKQEYKRESFNLFQEMLDNIQHDVVRFLARVEVVRPEEAEEMERRRREQQERQRMLAQHAEASAFEAQQAPEPKAPAVEPFVRDGRKVGRNDPCPCGSGKKFKQCHGKLGAPAPMADADFAPNGAKRNEPCPCGSGKKFKQCCGKIA